MGFCTINDNIEIHYQWINEKASGTPLVFLHEALGSIGQWKDFPEKLCTALNRKGLVYERQGHGLSSPFKEKRKSNFLYKYAIEELPAVLRALEIDEPVDLFGHSDGATIALLFAAYFPLQTNRVLSEAAHVFVEKETVDGVKPAKVLFETTDFKQKLAKYHPNDVESMFYAWHDIWTAPDFQDWNIEEELKKIKAEVLAIQGDQDEYGTLAQLDSILEHTGGECTIEVVKGCKHIPHLQQKQKTLDLAIPFFI